MIVLPILTKRRTQCGILCPFGAFQSATNKLNVFDIRIDKEKCVECGLCARVCPTFSMDEASIQRGRSRISCMKCGKCVDACPKTAISFHVKGSTGCGGMLARVLYLYPAFLFLAVMAGRNVQDAMLRIIRFALTGSMI